MTRRADNLPLAVSAVVFTVLALSLGDAVIKLVSGGFPLWQLFVVRSAVAIPLLLAISRIGRSPPGLMPTAPGWTAARSLMLALMWVAYYAALPHVPLSAAAAVYYTLPLFITLMAAAVLHEKVGLAGWFAVLLGFTGVLLILKPRGEDFNAWALLPLVSAILYAGAMILTRTRCRDEHPLVLSLSLNLVMIAIGAVATLALVIWPPAAETVQTNSFLFGPWTTMATREWLIAGMLALVIIIGSVGAAIAYQNGPSSIVATFDFAYLAFAAIWGFVFFTEVPDSLTVTGMAMIAIAGLIAVRR